MPEWWLPSASCTQTLSPSLKPSSITSLIGAQSMRQGGARGRSAGAEPAQISPVDLHRAVLPVAVGLGAQARHELAVVGGAEALVVADHVAHADPVVAAQVLGQAQRRA